MTFGDSRLLGYIDIQVHNAVRNQCLLFFISCCLQVGHVKILQNYLTTLLKTQLFHTVVSNLQIIIFHLWEEQAFLSGKSCSPSPAANGTWHAAVPCYLHNVSSKALNQRSNNLMVLGQDRRVGAATLSIQNLLFLWTSCQVGPTVSS
jgi:hypothetical protein